MAHRGNLCFNAEDPFFQGPDITEDVLCAGKEATFKFMQDVIDEGMEVFPSRYVHMGGDKAPKTCWKACPQCQARIKSQGLKNERELQSYFVARMEKYPASKGRCLIGWDEILEGSFAPGAALMSWRGMSGGIAAAKAGHSVVMSPTSHCYFDYDYRAIDERRAYGFDPIAGLNPQQARFVIALQANFWSHIEREPARVDTQLFPRLLAIAERGRSPASAGDWSTFDARLQKHLAWLEQLGIACRDGARPFQPRPIFTAVAREWNVPAKACRQRWMRFCACWRSSTNSCRSTGLRR